MCAAYCWVAIDVDDDTSNKVYNIMIGGTVRILTVVVCFQVEIGMNVLCKYICVMYIIVLYNSNSMLYLYDNNKLFNVIIMYARYFYI